MDVVMSNFDGFSLPPVLFKNESHFFFFFNERLSYHLLNK